MAGDWIKMRDDLYGRVEFHEIGRRLHISQEKTLLGLYRLAGWFQRHGKYGKLEAAPVIVDRLVGIDGFADALLYFGWMRQHDNGVMTLHVFCTVSTSRKSLGRRLRRKLLAAGKCSVCGSGDELVIDHKTPIVQGGSCEEENLHVLCAACNRSKGRKSMEEWRPTHGG